MQPPPSAADLLATVAEVLTDEIVPALSGPSQHHARVAASLVGIVERELRLGPDACDREHAALAALLDDVGTGTSLDVLRARIASALRAGLADDPDTERAVWDVLMDSVTADVAIAKPGHDRWDGD